MWRVVLFWSVAMVCAGALAWLLFATGARAQSVTGLSCDNGLSFGSIVAGQGTVIIDPTLAANNRSATGAVVLLTSGQFSQGGRATCTATTTGGFNYSISLATPTITLSNGSSTMSVNLAVSTTQLVGGGTGEFYVGGTLNVPGTNQAAGAYSGTYSVTVVYP